MIQEPVKTTKPGQTDIHPVLQIVMIFFLVFGLCIVGFFAAQAIISVLYGPKITAAVFAFNVIDSRVTSGLWILQIVSTTLPLFIVPVFFAKVIARNTPEYLRATVKTSPVLFLLVFAIMLVSSPIMEALSNFNQKLVLPGPLKAIEDIMRSMEQAAQKATEAMLHMNTIWNMLWAVFVVALLTAIAEEFLFRGVIQTIFLKWTKNKHVAIWITAILFSAFHMEFFTFLPRVFLGVIFGYFVVYSGSIWTSVWAHFLNNGSAVVITYLFQHKTIKLDPDDQHVFNLGAYAFSLIIVLFLLFVYRKVTMDKKLTLN
jgi:membrane protease YdiL (CAAX protease family)